MSSVEFFTPPDGGFIDNPDPTWLKHLVLEGGREFWNAGAGQGMMTFKADAGWRTTLLLTLDEALGFSLEYKDRERDAFISVRDPADLRRVTTYVGGDPYLLAAGWFVSRQAAWDVVREFIETGERSARVRWEPSNALDWNEFGGPS